MNWNSPAIASAIAQQLEDDMQVFLDILFVILAVEFGSGLLHWLEDSYGQLDWPITGKWITEPNILHHRAPSAFTANS
jgi:hypothetical protein